MIGSLIVFAVIIAFGSLDTLGAQQAQRGGASLVGLLFPLLILFGIFYFLLILPQQRQEKKRKEMLSKLKKGDRVVTTGGIIGTIQRIEESIVTLKVSANTNLKIEKGAIKAVLTPVEGGENSK